MTEPPYYPPPPAPYGTPPPYGPGPYPYPPPPATNGMAIASLICAFVFAPLGIVFGHISLSQIRRSGEEGRGLAIAGLVISYLVTVLTILAVIAGIALFGWAAKVVREEAARNGGAGIPVRPVRVEPNYRHSPHPPAWAPIAPTPRRSPPPTSPSSRPAPARYPPYRPR